MCVCVDTGADPEFTVTAGGGGGGNHGTTQGRQQPCKCTSGLRNCCGGVEVSEPWGGGDGVGWVSTKCTNDVAKLMSYSIFHT